MNPRINDDVKRVRGTYRKDREYKKVDRDPEEKIPRRPSELTGYGAKFWRAHVHQLWDDGWLCRKTAYSFVLVCDLYHDWQTLKDYCDEHGNYYEQVQQFGITKPMERPQYKRLNLVRESMFKKYADMGITNKSRRDIATDKAKKKPAKTKPNIRAFTGLEVVK